MVPLTSLEVVLYSWLRWGGVGLIIRAGRMAPVDELYSVRWRARILWVHEHS